MASAPPLETKRTCCCIAGGGPAGMVLGFLLARAGVDVIVLEKHADFLRDFRGDTVHPSTLEIIHELGLLDEFLKRPHQELKELSGMIGGVPIRLADFSHVPAHCKFIALMPQWDFLDFLAAHARRYANFSLLMQAEVTGLLTEGKRVTGVQANTQQGPLRVEAALVVGADGRHSLVREQAQLARKEFGVPIDVFWMRLSKRPSDPSTTLGRIAAGAIFVTLDRGDYWQCAFVISKGSAEAARQAGLESFRKLIVHVAPEFADRVTELTDWNQIKLLTVAVDRLEEWCRPGLLCIGDCAHAMSPVAGVGINLAVQDAVAAANILAAPLLNGAPSFSDLQKVQKRRELPTRLTQKLQMIVQDRVMARVLTLKRNPKPPFFLNLLDRFVVLRRMTARLIGMGFRPEHVRTPERIPAGPN
ncbi:MAG TPA: FAD-dependent oxidoreductase [Micropepsaceae bacterium]|nr:FAD-dependent oxidoreductase [Micropepsaceae bacterium]